MFELKTPVPPVKPPSNFASPLNYLGNRAATYDDVFATFQSFRKHKPYGVCYDLFSGSLSMTLKAMQLGLAQQYVVNDVFAPLQEFWRVLAENAGELKKAYAVLVEGYNRADDKNAYYQMIQANLNQILEQKPSELTPAVRYQAAANFAFVMNYSRDGLPKVQGSNSKIKLVCELAPIVTEFDFAKAVDEIAKLLRAQKIKICCERFEIAAQQMLSQVSPDDVVILDPPYPDLADDVYERTESKAILSQQLQAIITQLDAKKIPFVMFYAALGFANAYPIHWPKGHVLRISGSSTSAFGEYIEHVYFSSEVVREIEHLDAHYRKRLQPCFYRLVETHALRGDAVALVWGEERTYTMNYAQMNKAINRLSHYLLQEVKKLKTQPIQSAQDPLLALYLPQGPLLIISMLACMKAGIAYIPIETLKTKLKVEAAAERITKAGALLVITQAPLEKDLQLQTPKLVLSEADVECQRLCAAQPATWEHNPNVDVRSEHLAYVMNTSGSTGEPKGVEVTQRGLTYAYESHQDLLNLSPSDRVVQVARSSFDASLMEIMMGLGSGARLYLPGENVLASDSELMNYLMRHEITVMIQTPNKLSKLDAARLAKLRGLLIVGDGFDEKLSNAWIVDGRVVINGYGLTETSIVTTLGICQRGKPLTIGDAILGLEVFLRPMALELDEAGEYLDSIDEKAFATTVRQNQWLQAHPSADEKQSAAALQNSADGILYVSGPCLARGYRQRPDLTKAAFYSVDGKRYYRSGDKGHFEQGQLVLTGRADGQVKIRGQRTELKEVERALQQEGVKEVCVVAHSPRAAANGTAQSKSLVAYIESNENEAMRQAVTTHIPTFNSDSTKIIPQLITEYAFDSMSILSRLRQNIKQHKPAYMVPDLNRMRLVHALPRKANDKRSVDVKALVAYGTGPFRLPSSHPKKPPADQQLWDFIEQSYAKILQLNPEDFDAFKHSFSELGGDSLKVSQLLELLNRRAPEHEKYCDVIRTLQAGDILESSVFQVWNMLRTRIQQQAKMNEEKQQKLASLPTLSMSQLLLDVTNFHDDKFYGHYHAPFFAVHSLLGDAVIDYRGKGLESLPMQCVPLSAPTWACSGEEIADAKQAVAELDKLVTAHLKTIKANPTVGPCWILGWSTGGVVGSVLAQRLRQEGTRVFLWSLDSHHPSWIQNRDATSETKLLHDIVSELNKALMVALDLTEGNGFTLQAKFEILSGADMSVRLLQVDMFFKKLKQQFEDAIKGRKIKPTQELRGRQLIESAHALYKIELLIDLPKQLSADDYLIIADEKADSSSVDKLGWEPDSKAKVIKLMTTHFALLNHPQLPEKLQQQLVTQIQSIDAPYFQGMNHTLLGDQKAAAACYEVAATGGHKFAQHNLSVAYFNGDGVRRDPRRGFELLQKAAAQGLAESEFQLGACLASGRGTSKDAKAAGAWFQRAAGKGHVLAQRSIATCYKDGNGVACDPTQAIAWYECAALQNDGISQLVLAMSYEGHNKLVPTDYAKSHFWYRNAAQNGVSAAQFMLGITQLTCIEYENETHQAFHWLMQAAHPKNQKDGWYKYTLYWLACCYDNGIGTPVDKDRAKGLLKQAKLLSLPCAKKMLEHHDKRDKIEQATYVYEQALMAKGGKKVPAAVKVGQTAATNTGAEMVCAFYETNCLGLNP